MSPDDPYLTFRRVPPECDRASLEAFAAELHRSLAPGIHFHCMVTTDAELRRLNAQYRGKNSVTDVLSFPQSNDIAIAWPRARAQATQFGHTLGEELCVLMLHGVLHLMGMDHETDRGAMAKAETKWRNKLGLPSGLISRVGAAQ